MFDHVLVATSKPDLWVNSILLSLHLSLITLLDVHIKKRTHNCGEMFRVQFEALFYGGDGNEAAQLPANLGNNLILDRSFIFSAISMWLL